MSLFTSYEFLVVEDLYHLPCFEPIETSGKLAFLRSHELADIF